MLKNIIIIVALFCFVKTENIQEHDTNNYVQPKVLTIENFKKVLNEPELGTFVMFHAPWCGHCKKMIPTWEELAQTHNSNEKRFTIAKVDCTVDVELCSDEEILGYPTFIFYKNGETKGIRYEKQLAYEHLEGFMFDEGFNKDNLEELKQTKKQLVKLTDENFEKSISKGYHFIKFFAPWCGHCKSMAETWKELVGYNSEIEIAEVDCTTEKKTCGKYEIQGFPTLLFFKDSKKIDVYQGDRKIESFKSYIDMTTGFVKKSEDSQRGSVLAINTVNSKEIFNKPGLLFVKFFAPWCGHCKNMAAAWAILARSYAPVDEVTIAEVDCTESYAVCKEFDVKGYPTILLYKNGKKFEEYSNKRNFESFIEFLTPHFNELNENQSETTKSKNDEL